MQNTVPAHAADAVADVELLGTHADEGLVIAKQRRKGCPIGVRLLRKAVKCIVLVSSRDGRGARGCERERSLRRGYYRWL